MVNKLLSAANLSDLLPQSGQNILIIGGRPIIRQMQTLAARLAVSRPVCILDGGNRLEPYLLATEIRRLGKDPNVYLNNISVTRAFSSVQFQSMVQKAAGSVRPGSETVYFVLDTLLTFYDESLPQKESRRLLALSIHSLLTIGRNASLVVQIKPLNQSTAGKAVIFEQLCRSFSNTLSEYEQPPAAPIQPELF